jgi:hypothetical protein
VEERAVGWRDARTSGGGIVGVYRRFSGGYPVTAHVRTRSTVFHLKTRYLHPSDHEYQCSLP